MLPIYEKHPPFTCIYTKGFAWIRESFALFRESFALIRENYALIREKFPLFRERYALIREIIALFRESYALIREKYYFFLYQNEPNSLSYEYLDLRKKLKRNGMPIN